MSYLIGVGASAGGLDALSEFFRNTKLRKDTSYVVVQHLSPDYKSLMKELLAKYTEMPIFVVENEMQIHSGNIYLIPPKNDMRVSEGVLYLDEYKVGKHLNTPIDNFFHSLAEDFGPRSIAVILSGTGSDGTRGIRTIKDSGGLILTQDEFSAQFDGMPKSAIYTGLVDYILAPEEMGAVITKHIDNHILLSKNTNDNNFLDIYKEELRMIYMRIKSIMGLDLSYYKQNTIMRRIERRMSTNHITNLSDYLNLLDDNSKELQTLSQEILIGVTRFFRDEEMFEIFEKEVLPEIMSNKKENEDLRIWITACSTGEEVYSYAFIIDRFLKKFNLDINVKIFATDIDRNAIDFASSAIYPKSAVTDVPKDVLEANFNLKDEYYQVKKNIRENIVFSCHNLINDPPFNNTDFISCRNLLIYFQLPLQKKVMAYFDYSIVNNGYLILGPSETTGTYDRTFKTVNSRWKIFKHKKLPGFKTSAMDTSTMNMAYGRQGKKVIERGTSQVYTTNRLYKSILTDFMKPSVVVDNEYNIVMLAGKVTRFLTLPDGEPSFKVNSLLEGESNIFVNAALRKAFTHGKTTKIKYKYGAQNLELVVEKISNDLSYSDYCIITFNELDKVEKVEEIHILDDDVKSRIFDLEQDLQYTRENLQATNEELETSNEELQATNEELLSSNEELQSTNEELQSVNEELITLNSEYQEKISQLTDTNNDMTNLLNSTHIGTVFLDNNLKIKRFTPAIKSVIDLIKTDIGRSISHFSSKLLDVDMITESKKVLSDLIPIEKEVNTLSGNSYIVKIQPYRTTSNRINGVVITFIDTTETNRIKNELKEVMFNINDVEYIVCVTDSKGKILHVNEKMCEATQYQKKELIGQYTSILKSGKTERATYTDLWNTLSNDEEWIGMFINQRKDGTHFVENCKILPLFGLTKSSGRYIKIAKVSN